MTTQFLNDDGAPVTIPDPEGGMWVLDMDSSGKTVSCKALTTSSGSSSGLPSDKQGTAGLLVPIIAGVGLILSGVM